MRLPRWALVLFCAAYLIPGFIGREAWKSADMTALGFMTELVQGSSDWFSPKLLGQPPEHPALLPYWLGAWAVQWSPDWVASDFAARLPFVGLLALCLAGTWYATYLLASSPRAQPVPFAFGGEALPRDYARAMADGGLLALIACLGLAQLAHETTPALAQTSFAALAFFGFSALRHRPKVALVGGTLGLAGMSLSGAPAMALFFGIGAAVIQALEKAENSSALSPTRSTAITTVFLAVAIAVAASSAWWLDLWQWSWAWPEATWPAWNALIQLLIWFTWPAWPLALWTLWRWRRQLIGSGFSRHIALPLWFVAVTLVATLGSSASDRTLMIGLPALASLAAFALPTLKRQVAALIDWFTLLFFSACGLTIWVVWIAMQTGFPRQPAANVMRLAPGFESSFSPLVFGVAVIATLVWAWLVKWRVGRHRAAVWKSLVLPAGGAALCWLLLMSLWMPLLNYAQSYTAMVNRVVNQLDPPGCAEVLSLGTGKIAALQVYGNLTLMPVRRKPECPWLLAEPTAEMEPPINLNTSAWVLLGSVQHPTDGNEAVLIFRRR